MKTMKTRILTIIVVLALAISMLCGCSSQKEAAEAPAEPSAQQSETVSEAPQAEADTAPSETLAEESVYPLVDEKVTLTAYAPIRSENTAVVTEMGDWETIQLAEEITNVHIEWQSVSSEQYSEMCPIMVASGDYPDLLYSLNQGFAGGLTKAYAEEVVIDMSTMIHEFAPNYCALLDGIDRGWQRASTEDGNVLAFYSLNSDSNQQGILIRGDWLDEQQLEIPETVEQFLDMLYCFKDAYGVAPLQMSSATQEGLLFTSAYDVPGYQVSIFGSGSYWYQVDNLIHCALVEDGYRETLTLMNQLYNDGMFSPDFYTFGAGSNDESKNSLISSNIVGVLSANDSMVDAYTDLISEIDGAYFVVAKNPVLNAGDLIHFGNRDEVSNGATTAAISTQCENVELALQYLDFWYSHEGIMAFNYGIEGKTYTVLDDGTAEYTDIIENNEWNIGYTSAINTYCPIGNIPSYSDIRRFRQYYTDLTSDAVELWGNATDLAYVLPTITLTTEESEVYNGHVNDIETYAQESVLSFITGKLDIATQWDEYVATLESMGLQENQDIYQAALDRLG